jgi:hypothetical protein
MTPNKVAASASRTAIAEGVADFKRRTKYSEQHDVTVVKINRQWKPAQEKTA